MDGPMASGSYVNVIDLIICEATPNEHVICTLVWINSNTSIHSNLLFSVAKKSCKVCPGRRDMVSYRRFERSRLFSASLSYPCFSKNVKISLNSSGFARSGMCNSPPDESARGLHQASDPVVVQSTSHHPWILRPRLRLET